jgi:hypothetical protein
MWLLLVFASAAVGVLLNEFTDWLPRLGERLILRAGSVLPEKERERYEMEWLEQLELVPGRLSKLVFALRVTVRTPLLRTALKRRGHENLPIRPAVALHDVREEGHYDWEWLGWPRFALDLHTVDGTKTSVYGTIESAAPYTMITPSLARRLGLDFDPAKLETTASVYRRLCAQPHGFVSTSLGESRFFLTPVVVEDLPDSYIPEVIWGNDFLAFFDVSYSYETFTVRTRRARRGFAWRASARLRRLRHRERHQHPQGA